MPRRTAKVYDIVNAGPRHRFTANRKLVSNCELFLGYQGGVGAFITGAATYGIDLDAMARAVLPNVPREVLRDAEGFLEWTNRKRRSTFGLDYDTFIACESIKRMWRAEHPNFVAGWKALEDNAIAAIKNPGRTFEWKRLAFRRDGVWLRIRMPSGFCLCYAEPQYEDGQISYAGINQFNRQWRRLYTHGGKLLENATQLVATGMFGLLGPAMKRAEAAGYRIVLRVHDELVTETPDRPEFNAAHLSALFAANEPWTDGLPLSAAGFECYSYRKA
jgi:DNA polymerase